MSALQKSLTEVQSAQRELATCSDTARRRRLAVFILARSYGGDPAYRLGERRWQDLLRADGQPRKGVISAPSSRASHRLTVSSADPLQAVEDLSIPTEAEYRSCTPETIASWEGQVDRSAKRRIGLEIRGVCRALWLSVLWAGRDPSPLRREWYHSADLQPYWGWARRLSTSAEASEKMVQYLRGLLWSWSERSDGRNHSGAKLLARYEEMT